ncbi:MAG: hypothetical protein KDA93_05885 [Planctomycetaceae bacterium]|nr:hypothetical protein [Planctomycetaceae bacterium]
MTQVHILCLTLLLAGCSSFDTSSLLGRSKFVEAGPKNPVVDVVCLWEPAEGRGLDNLPARGFAGQLLFLTRGTAEPAKIEGEIRVYVFDDQGIPEEQSKPLHQYDFKGQAFSQYLCETNMGAAYQLFIPYPRKGSHEAKCAIRVRYTPADGGSPVYSKMADLTLPGAKPKETADSWQPKRRRSHTAVGNITGEPPNKGLAKGTTPSISMTTDRSTVQRATATSAHARLQRVAAQLAEEQGAEEIQSAVHETSDERPRRFRLND